MVSAFEDDQAADVFQNIWVRRMDMVRAKALLMVSVVGVRELLSRSTSLGLPGALGADGDGACKDNHGDGHPIIKRADFQAKCHSAEFGGDDDDHVDGKADDQGTEGEDPAYKPGSTPPATTAPPSNLRMGWRDLMMSG